jgi:hypothetical protein
MNAIKFIAAAAAFATASLSFAAEPAANASATAVAAVATAALGATSADSKLSSDKLNVPTVTITSGRTRAEVRAEAVIALKNYKNTLATQLAQYQ